MQDSSESGRDGSFITVFAIDVLKGYGEQAGGEKGGTDVGQGEIGDPGGTGDCADPVGEKQERDTENDRNDCQ